MSKCWNFNAQPTFVETQMKLLSHDNPFLWTNRVIRCAMEISFAIFSTPIFVFYSLCPIFSDFAKRDAFVVVHEYLICFYSFLWCNLFNLSIHGRRNNRLLWSKPNMSWTTKLQLFKMRNINLFRSSWYSIKQSKQNSWLPEINRSYSELEQRCCKTNFHCRFWCSADILLIFITELACSVVHCFFLLHTT